MIPNGATIHGYHTYDDLGLIPCHILTVDPPLPKIIKHQIMGRSGGIDTTERICGAIPYANVHGSWDFIVKSGLNYPTVYSNCMSILNGNWMEMMLDDDLYITFYGRFNVNKWKSFEEFSRLTIDYNIEPW